LTPGLLFAGMDVGTDAVPAFDTWYDTEHIPERQAVPGVGEVCRWRSIAGGLPRNLVTYELVRSSVLDSTAYRALKRAGDTPLTRSLKQRMTRVERHEFDLVYETVRGPDRVSSGWAVMALSSDDLDREVRVLVDAGSQVPGAATRSRYFHSRNDRTCLQLHDCAGWTEAATFLTAVTPSRVIRVPPSVRVGVCVLLVRHVPRQSPK